MGKVFKILLMTFAIISGTILSIIVVFIAYVFFSMEYSGRNAERDYVEHTILCDTIPFIDEQPDIWFEDFEEHEIMSLTFYILRNGELINDTVVTNSFKFTYGSHSKVMEIPYNYFLKTDTIVVKTIGGLSYYISGYHHYANLHYGMFGYLGHSDCRVSDDCIINNQESRGRLFKKWGWMNPEKSKHIKILSPYSEEFKDFAEQSNINYDRAEHILNEQLYRGSSKTVSHIEKGPDTSFYVFEERTLNDDIYIIKIDTETGEYKRFIDYPYDNDPTVTN